MDVCYGCVYLYVLHEEYLYADLYGAKWRSYVRWSQAPITILSYSWKRLSALRAYVRTV